LARHRKKLTKKELKEDEVAEFFLESGEYLREHSKKIVGLVIVALIAVLVVTVAMRQRRAAELEARGWIARANIELKQGNVDGAIQSYSTTMDRYRGTWSHSDANFFAANAQFMSGRYDSSLVLFERYLSLSKRREEFTVSSKLGIAQCLEQLGRYGDAAESYLKVQREHQVSPLAPDALLGAARCYELAGDLRMAESTYSDLLDLYPDSNQANLARMPLLEIQAKLENT
jgi:outer membrane protein assembly factor BamD (BamD/ComL family)